VPETVADHRANVVNQAVARLNRVEHAVEITPVACAAALGPLNSCTPRWDAAAGQLRHELVRHFDVVRGRDEPCVDLPAGHEDRAVTLLERAGWAIERCGDRPPSLAEPNRGRLRGPRPVDRALLRHVRHRDLGLIRHGAGVDPARLVAQVALAFPDESIAVVAVREADAQAWAQRLQAMGVRQARWHTSGSSCRRPTRVLVTTPKGFNSPEADPFGRTILIAADAAEALGKEAGRPFEGLAYPRMWGEPPRRYGLLPAARRCSPADLMELRGRFGPEVHVPRHGAVVRRVVLRRERIEGGRDLRGLAGVDLLRHGIWAHEVRSRRLARVAEERAGDGGGAVRRTVVLAANLDQALALAARLLDWPLVLGEGPVVDAGLRDAEVRLLRERVGLDMDGHGRAIATPDGLHRLARFAPDVVVRADGGIGVPEGVAALLVSEDPDAPPLTLVDADDRHHPELRRQADDRFRAYGRLGWDADAVRNPARGDAR
jgi:hypothetical protein